MKMPLHDNKGALASVEEKLGKKLFSILPLQKYYLQIDEKCSAANEAHKFINLKDFNTSKSIPLSFYKSISRFVQTDETY